ncbi:MAG: hypothetical protein ACOY44_08245 [Pseudomonadota bacterium]
MKIHLCLISDQPLANLLAAVDREHGCDKAALAVSPQMHGRRDIRAGCCAALAMTPRQVCRTGVGLAAR